MSGPTTNREIAKMAKLNLAQVQADKMYLFAQIKKGKPLTLIALELNEKRDYLITVQSLSKMYYFAMKEAAEERNPAAEIDRTLQEIDWIIQEAIKAWYKSLGPEETTLVMTEKGATAEGDFWKDSESVKKVHGFGNANYLTTVLRALERRSKLLGLDQPQRVEVKLRKVLEEAGIDDEIGMTNYVKPIFSEAEIIDDDENEGE